MKICVLDSKAQVHPHRKIVCTFFVRVVDIEHEWCQDTSLWKTISMWMPPAAHSIEGDKISPIGQEALLHMTHVRVANEGVELVYNEPVLHNVIGSR